MLKKKSFEAYLSVEGAVVERALQADLQLYSACVLQLTKLTVVRLTVRIILLVTRDLGSSGVNCTKEREYYSNVCTSV